MKQRILFRIFQITAVMIGLYPLIYFIIDRKFGLLHFKDQELLNNIFWNTAFYTHITMGGIALLIGWSQFSEKLRNKNLQLHRTIGKIYVTAALLSSLASLYIAHFATGGLITIIGFTTLGLIWFLATIRAYASIRNGNVILHQQMMIFSYAACFSAVTLRIWMPLLSMIFHDFITGYQIVSWLCWVPNILVAFIFARKVSNKNILNNPHWAAL